MDVCTACSQGRRARALAGIAVLLAALAGCDRDHPVPREQVFVAGGHEYKPDHQHDEAVTSVGISMPGDVDEKKMNTWMGNLLKERGQDIFRMKGVLSIKGEAERFVFQGVHMLFTGTPDRPWGSEPRHNTLVFIGRNLDRAELHGGFRACLA